MRLARFSLHFARNRMTPYVANVHDNHYLEEKNEYVSQHTIEDCSACVNVHNSRTR